MTNYVKIYVPKSSVNAYKEADVWREFLIEGF